MESSLAITARNLRILGMLALGILAVSIQVPAQVAELIGPETSSVPFFAKERILLLYFAAPVVALASIVWFLLPGLMLARLNQSVSSFGQFLLHGLTFSMLSQTAAVVCAQLILGQVITGRKLLIVSAALVVSIDFIIRLVVPRARHRTVLCWPNPMMLATTLGLPTMALMVFSAKFYWGPLTPDAADSLFLSTNFIQSLWPFWPNEAGSISSGNMLSGFLYLLDLSWFQRLFGPYELVLRIPFLMHIALLPSAVAAIAEIGNRALTRFDHAMIAGASLLLLYSNTYSGGYYPYFADSILPGARETLAILFMCGAILAFFEGKSARFLAFAILFHLALPTGVIFVATCLALSFLPAFRTRQYVSTRLVALTLGALFLVSLATPIVLSRLGMPGPGGEFGIHSIANRLRFVTVLNTHEFMFYAVPIGVVPILVLPFVRHDPIAVFAALTSLVLFLFFYFQAYRVLQHHFIPASILALIAFWRMRATSWAKLRRIPAYASAVGLVIGFAAATPVSFKIYQDDKILGEQYALRLPQGVTSGAEWANLLNGQLNLDLLRLNGELIATAFPTPFSLKELAERQIISPLPILYYSFRYNGRFSTDYPSLALVSESDVPESSVTLATKDGYSLISPSENVVADLRFQHRDIETGSPFLQTPRDIMFRGSTGGPRHVVDLLAPIKRWLAH